MYLNESESLVSGLQSVFFCSATVVLLSGNCKLSHLGVELCLCVLHPCLYVRDVKISKDKWVTEN